MKIALAQLNYTIGNFEANSQTIINAIEKAKTKATDIIVFSELSVCGYPPLDLLENDDFIQAVEKSVDKIAEHCTNITAIIGAPTLNPEKNEKRLHNSALILSQGKVQDTIHKTLLPTYDIFDEYRYFEPNKTFKTVRVGDKVLAVTICEDLWDYQPKEKKQLYQASPLEQIVTPFDLIINISASPFSIHQGQNRQKVLTEKAKQYQTPLVYVNQSSANTELIFDGHSMYLDAQGKVLYEMKRFEDDFQIFDTEQKPEIHRAEEPERIALLHLAIQKGLKDYFNKMGFKKAVLGLSGGIDSALVAALATEALGAENVVGILMPSEFSSDHSISDAIALAENLGIEHHTIPIKQGVDSFDKMLEPLFKGTTFSVAEENIQARIRGTILMAYSNKFGHILLNTSNKSEAAVGYSTLYGDMNGSLSILGDVYKTDVFKLSRYINRHQEIIPYNSIEKPPSAELRPDQKDSDSLPDYEVLDAILKLYIEEQKTTEYIISAGFDSDIVHKTIGMVNRNEYKRFQSPPILRLSDKAFGLGRRMPLVAKYNW